METKDILLDLRKKHHLSQDEYAGKLFVTRQAVSRWENGETMPNTDTLKLIADTFDVSIDTLLGHELSVCQSCGMTLSDECDKGTECDGSKSEEYCAFCYQNGEFTQKLTMKELIEHNLKDLSIWNKASGLNLCEQEAREQLLVYLPTLKRWQVK